MKYLLIIGFLISFYTAKSQEIWQLQPWPVDSNYVLSAIGSGEPTWVHKDSLGIISGIDSTIVDDGYGIDVVESPANTFEVSVDTNLIGTQYDLSLKQNTLVSGTNIKTINSSSILGSGNLDVGTVTGTGTATRVAFWSAASTLSSSANLYWDNASGFFAVYGAGAFGSSDLMKLEKTGGFGSTVFRQFYDGSTFKYGLRIGNGYSAANFITIEHNAGQVGIGTDTPSRLLDVNGEFRIRDLVTTNPTLLGGFDATGVGSAVTLGTGLSFTGTTLNASGTVGGTGTDGYLSRWNGTTALTTATGVYSNANGLGFGTTSPLFSLHLNNKSIYLQGNSTIIDKNNSGGTAGYFLMGTGGFGVDWEFLALSRTGARDLSLTGGSTLANCLVPTVGVADQVLTNTGSGTYAWQNNVSNTYGQLYNTGNLTSQTLDGTDREIDFTTALVNTFTANTTNNTLTFPANGTYRITYSFSYQLDVSGSNTIYIEPYVNGSTYGYNGQLRSNTYSSNAGHIESVSRTFILTATSGQTLELYYSLFSGSATLISFYNLNMTAERLK